MKFKVTQGWADSGAVFEAPAGCEAEPYAIRGAGAGNVDDMALGAVFVWVVKGSRPKREQPPVNTDSGFDPRCA